MDENINKAKLTQPNTQTYIDKYRVITGKSQQQIYLNKIQVKTGYLISFEIFAFFTLEYWDALLIEIKYKKWKHLKRTYRFFYKDHGVAMLYIFYI